MLAIQAGDVGSVPGQGVKILHAAQYGQKKQEENREDIWSWKPRAEMEGVVTMLAMEDGK